MAVSISTSGQRVVVRSGHEHRVEVEAFAVPLPGPDEVLIEITCTLISAGTELGSLKQRRVDDYSPGYSNVGRIIARVDRVKDRQVGDRVLSLGSHASDVVSFTESHQLHPIPDGVVDEEGAFGVLGSVAMHGVRMGRIELGEHVMVTGMGVVGQLVMRLAAGIQSETRIAVDLSDTRLQKARASGATHAFNPRTDDLHPQIQSVTGDRGLDLVVEGQATPMSCPGSSNFAGSAAASSC